jgi:hypothetical protein
MYGVLPDVVVLATVSHVSYNSPLSWLSCLSDREQRAICFHLTVVRNQFENPNLPKFINEFGCDVGLFLGHWSIRGGSFVWFRQEIHGAPIA